MRDTPSPKAPIPSLGFGGIKVYCNEYAPTHKLVIEDGEAVLDENGNEKRVPVFYSTIMGDIHVHPDRWDEFQKLVNKAKL